MLPRQTPEKRAKTLSQRKAAKLLGVTPWHLNRVLRGHRESRSLLARYAALQAKHAAAPESPETPAT
jgi:hypothetical protein